MSSQATEANRTLERLSKEYAELKSEKDGLAGQIKQLEESLDGLKNELKEQFGSDDLENLQELLAEKEAENEQKCQKYERDLNDVKQKLEAVELAVESDQEQPEEEQ